MHRSVALWAILQRLLFCVVAVVLKLILDEFYVLFSKDFAYYGMRFNPVSWQEYWFSLLAVGWMAFLIGTSNYKPSTVALMLLYIFCFIPAATVFSMNAHHPKEGFYGLLITFLLISLLLRVRFFPTWDFAVYLKREAFFSWLLFVFTLLLLYVFVSYGLNVRWVGFGEVYEVRAKFAGQSSRMSGYVYGWLSHVVNMALMLWALHKKQYWLLGTTGVMQVYLYNLGGHKSVLLLMPFLLWIYAGVRYAMRFFSLYLLGSMTLICGILLLHDWRVEQYSDTSSLIIRRNLLLPAQIYFYYVDYFSRHYADFFAQHFPFGLFYDSHYQEKLPVIIGKNYFSFKEGIYANGNVFADLFANLGRWSFVLGAILVAFTLKLFDRVAADRNSLFVIPLAAISVISLSNSGLIVNLITHGLLLMIAMVAIYPKTIFVLKFVKKKPLV